ncbi:uncharacterized protein MONOS_4576 [Monocercomonoides exilis]|uniref:uncharacterized protein n=1 Tax=Monocercomonoides exilis TaxID=2049356 RepID=UPI00355A124F|nr:hypothetical protein MONOS_4576 [Monocercomonoides exilis]|eukprot:MONOS_4576.1-p1 / transcript=MONOS_4576.1 / gene=MONOS_4576 / organism=Monocercomonoides_exilis_PA203 / gene_product=unspecified product / transcript_product=unspecified product / location=Mono_scaffold00123:20606-22854(+) / protein_length=512 / sequence_SO=supercontig / SO=protein_coding / is_pseudo=false
MITVFAPEIDSLVDKYRIISILESFCNNLLFASLKSSEPQASCKCFEQSSSKTQNDQSNSDDDLSSLSSSSSSSSSTSTSELSASIKSSSLYSSFSSIYEACGLHSCLLFLDMMSWRSVVISCLLVESDSIFHFLLTLILLGHQGVRNEWEKKTLWMRSGAPNTENLQHSTSFSSFSSTTSSSSSSSSSMYSMTRSASLHSFAPLSSASVSVPQTLCTKCREIVTTIFGNICRLCAAEHLVKLLNHNLHRILVSFLTASAFADEKPVFCREKCQFCSELALFSGDSTHSNSDSLRNAAASPPVFSDAACSVCTVPDVSSVPAEPYCYAFHASSCRPSSPCADASTTSVVLWALDQLLWNIRDEWPSQQNQTGQTEQAEQPHNIEMEEECAKEGGSDGFLGEHMRRKKIEKWRSLEEWRQSNQSSVRKGLDESEKRIASASSVSDKSTWNYERLSPSNSIDANEMPVFWKNVMEDLESEGVEDIAVHFLHFSQALIPEKASFIFEHIKRWKK